MRCRVWVQMVHCTTSQGVAAPERDPVRCWRCVQVLKDGVDGVDDLLAVVDGVAVEVHLAGQQGGFDQGRKGIKKVTRRVMLQRELIITMPLTTTCGHCLTSQIVAQTVRCWPRYTYCPVP